MNSIEACMKKTMKRLPDDASQQMNSIEACMNSLLHAALTNYHLLRPVRRH